MDCYFCSKAMIENPPDRGTRHFECQEHPYKVYYDFNTRDNTPQLTCMRFSFEDKEYQAIWYLKGGLHLFRVYRQYDDYGIQFELNKGIDNITPENIEGNLPKWFLFA